MLLCREHGKTIGEAKEELSAAANVLRWHARQSDALASEDISDHRGRMFRQRVPVGVVAVIVPWIPGVVGAVDGCPALLAGNAVVAKLPEHAPLTLALLLRNLAAALPAGILNVVAGGSIRTGRDIMRSASSTLKSLSLELGGNDAAIIMPDASITDELATELSMGMLTCAGQVCYAPKRLFVHRPKVDRFRDAMLRATADVVVGDGSDPNDTMGPLNNAASSPP